MEEVYRKIVNLRNDIYVLVLYNKNNHKIRRTSKSSLDLLSGRARREPSAGAVAFGLPARSFELRVNSYILQLLILNSLFVFELVILLEFVSFGWERAATPIRCESASSQRPLK